MVGLLIDGVPLGGAFAEGEAFESSVRAAHAPACSGPELLESEDAVDDGDIEALMVVVCWCEDRAYDLGVGLESVCE